MIIRRINEKDTEKYLDMLKKLDTETSFMMYEPGERKTSLEEIKSYIRGIYESDSLLIGAVEGDEIVGFLSAERGFANRIKHSAYIVTGILKEHRGKGIGKQLFTAMDSWSRESSISRLELTVMMHNEGAVSLYKKMGFEIEGIKKRSLVVDGQFVDEYYMAKLID